jgi:hypothetical protein
MYQFMDEPNDFTQSRKARKDRKGKKGLLLGLLMLVGVHPCELKGQDVVIQKGRMRVAASKQDGRYYLTFNSRRENGSWRTILATAAEAKVSPWDPDETQHLAGEDLRMEWKEEGQPREAESFIDSVAAGEDEQSLRLYGTAGPHRFEERIILEDLGRAHVTVRDLSAEKIDLGQLMSHFYLTPDGKSFGYALPLDFAWLPSLHEGGEGLSSDHFFRSPAVIAISRGAYAVLVPDLHLLAKHRPIPHALDLRVTGTKCEAPRLSYGLSTYGIGSHVYARHRRGQTASVNGGDVAYGFDLFFGEADAPREVTTRIAAFLWQTYGHVAFEEIRPQVLPFEEYGRRYSYAHELKRWATTVRINGKDCAGINNKSRHGANFHAWENDLHVAFGVAYYGNKWHSEDLRRIADGILQLSLAAPRKEGAFPCIYNFQDRKWEGSLYFTARSADRYTGYDAAAMGVTSWWQLYWYENYGRDPEILQKVADYAHFLSRAQLPSGAIPTYFYAGLAPAPQLLESATTALSGAVLAKTALLTGNPSLKAAALAAGRFIEDRVLPRLAFQDFETFYSCSPKPLCWTDNWSCILPQNTLSIEWGADQFLSLYRLTGESHWLRDGEYILSILSLYQQVWSPPYLHGYLYGGFGVQNSDGEWNDGRQARFVSTYADYYAATGKAEYLERAVAACRASFALMDMKENHENGINRQRIDWAPSEGYSAENTYHNGPKDEQDGWTGFNWGSGGGLTASAYLEQQFGTVWVDGDARQAIPINGVAASILAWNGESISLKVSNALGNLPYPFVEGREITIKFGHLRDPRYTLTINGQQLGTRTRKELETDGLKTRL